VYSEGRWQDNTSPDTSARQARTYSGEASLDHRTGSYIRSPWTFFSPFYLKFHIRAFLQALKGYLLKTTAVKENLLPIR
jgi:hypothetical protein